MVEELQISEKLEIDSIETLKVLSDPFRLDVLKRVGLLNKKGERATVKQISKMLGMPPTKLYYHINLLEEHGLLVVGDTQIVSGIIEKHYQVAAMSISVNKDIMSMNDGDRSDQLASIFESIKEVVDNAINNLWNSLGAIFAEVEREKKDDVPSREQIAMDIRNNELLLTRQQAREMVARINQIHEEFEQISDQNLQKESADELFFGVTQMIVPHYHRSTVLDDANDNDPTHTKK